MNKRIHFIFFAAVGLAIGINKIFIMVLEPYPYWWVLAAILFFTLVNYALLTIFDRIAVKNIDKAGYFFISTFMMKLLLILLYLKIFKAIAAFEKNFILNFSLIYLYFLGLSIFLGLKILDLRQRNKN